jgi:hypothetical protein
MYQIVKHPEDTLKLTLCLIYEPRSWETSFFFLVFFFFFFFFFLIINQDIIKSIRPLHDGRKMRSFNRQLKLKCHKQFFHLSKLTLHSFTNATRLEEALL